MLRMVGYGENLGSGFPLILDAWKQAGWEKPELKNRIDVDVVELVLPVPSTKAVIAANEFPKGLTDGLPKGLSKRLSDELSKGLSETAVKILKLIYLDNNERERCYEYVEVETGKYVFDETDKMAIAREYHESGRPASEFVSKYHLSGAVVLYGWLDKYLNQKEERKTEEMLEKSMGQARRI